MRDNPTLKSEQNDTAVVKHNDPAIDTLVYLEKIYDGKDFAQRIRHIDVLRESLTRKLKHANDDAEAAQDYCRKLMREGQDITDDLKQLECLGNAILLVAVLMRREAKGSA